MQEPSQKDYLLREAASEIRQLRQKNGIMAARLDMFDSVMLLFRTEPAFPREGMTEDLVWKIETCLNAPHASPQPSNTPQQ